MVAPTCSARRTCHGGQCKASPRLRTKPKGRSAAGRPIQPACAPVVLLDAATEPAADAARIIRQRRSAVAMDGRTRLTRASFFRMLARTMPDPGRPPWDAWPWPAAVFLGLFVHRVDGLAPGLYLLARAPERLDSFRETARGDWLAWQPVEDCPLPLWALMPGRVFVSDSSQR